MLLRLVIGWHFFGEGLKKVEYDRHDGQLHMVFSADTELLNLAKGPLAPLYLAHTPSDHEWRTLLASPRENVPKTPEQIAEQTKWVREYSQRQNRGEGQGRGGAGGVCCRVQRRTTGRPRWPRIGGRRRRSSRRLPA